MTDPTAPPCLAVDLGGTKVEAALVRSDGTIVPGTRGRAATGDAAANDRSVAEQAIRAAAAPAMAAPEWADVTAAGIGAAGPLDVAHGVIRPINIPALHGFAVVDFLAETTGLTDVALRLDGTCIALAELWRGAARDVRNAIVFVVSTGVGGGIISDGRVVTGRTGNAGHLGQVVVDRIDGDAAAATVEGIASGPRSVAFARSLGWQGWTGEDLARDYKAGVDAAVAAVRRSARAVGVGLVNAATLLDLELAVVGGGFAAVSEDYPELISAAIRDSAVNAYAAHLTVVRAGLGGDAPLVGAGALVHRRDLLTDPSP